MMVPTAELCIYNYSLVHCSQKMARYNRWMAVINLDVEKGKRLGSYHEVLVPFVQSLSTYSLSYLNSVADLG